MTKESIDDTIAPRKKKPGLLKRLFASHTSLRRPSKSNLPSISDPVVTSSANSRVSITEGSEKNSSSHVYNQTDNSNINKSFRNDDLGFKSQKRSSFLASEEVMHRSQGVSGSLIQFNKLKLFFTLVAVGLKYARFILNSLYISG